MTNNVIYNININIENIIQNISEQFIHIQIYLYLDIKYLKVL